MISQGLVRDTFLLLETFEKGLNIAGYIPWIGSFSASLRASYGSVEVIAGIASGILALGVHLQGNSSATSAYLTLAAALVGHGILNQIRSAFEYTPCLPWVTTLPYDIYATHVVGKRFFSYI